MNWWQKYTLSFSAHDDIREVHDKRNISQLPEKTLSIIASTTIVCRAWKSVGYYRACYETACGPHAWLSPYSPLMISVLLGLVGCRRCIHQNFQPMTNHHIHPEGRRHSHNSREAPLTLQKYLEIRESYGSRITFLPLSPMICVSSGIVSLLTATSIDHFL